MKNKKNDAPVAETLMPEVKVEEKSTEGTTTEVVKPKKRNYRKRVKKAQPVADEPEIEVNDPGEDICVCDCDQVAIPHKKSNWFARTWNKFALWFKFVLWFK